MFVAGDKIGAYVVHSRLGAGGMGEVYLAEHVHIGRKAAIKVLLPELSVRPDVVARFFNEARATGLLRHPNIVEVLDCDVLPSGQAYIVMELLGGETLSACLARVGSFGAAWPTALAIAGRIASGLSAAHAKGIVHRDLKPDNIYLVATQQPDAPLDVKVLDFGIAKLMGDGETSISRTRTGSLLGTPVYMSPEQCRGAGMVDSRADIYSLGCILFEMIGGKPPFLGAGAGELIAAHMFQPVPPLGSLAPSVPTEIVDLVTRMLAKLPGQRPQTMADVIAAIERLLQLPAPRFGEAISVPPGFPFPRDENPGMITSQPGIAATPSVGQASAETELAGRPTMPPGDPVGRPRTLVLPDANGPPAEAPPFQRPGGTLVADQAPSTRSTERPRVSGQRPGARSAENDGAQIEAHVGTNAGPRRSGRRWLFSSLLLLVAVGAPLMWARMRPKPPILETPPPPPESRISDPADPNIDRTPLTALLQVGAEPAWPAPCSTSAPELIGQLVNAAKNFAPGAPAQSRSRRLASLANLPDTVPERWLILARELLAHGPPENEPQIALQASERAVALCPSSAVAHNLRANALQKLPGGTANADPRQSLEDAAAAYRRASELAPEYTAPRFNLGLVRLRQRRPEEALAAFDTLAQGDAAYPNIHLVRAEAYRMQNRREEALAELKAQVAQQPDSADGWWQLSRALAPDPKQARAAACRARQLGHPAAAHAKGCKS